MIAAASFPYQPSEHPALAQRAWQLVAVVGLHVGVAVCLMHTQINKTTMEPVPLRMEVRAIEMPPSPLPQVAQPEVPKPVAAPPKPMPTVAPPVKRRPQPPAPAPVLAAAPSTEAAPSTFATAPTPAAPVKEAVASPEPPAPVAVQGPRFDADYLQNPAPAYPPVSRRMREEGKVLLLVRVSTTGSPEHIQIKQGSGFPRLDEAALDTVQRWSFVPARRGEETVVANVIVPIVFRLGG